MELRRSANRLLGGWTSVRRRRCAQLRASAVRRSHHPAREAKLGLRPVLTRFESQLRFALAHRIDDEERPLVQQRQPQGGT